MRTAPCAAAAPALTITAPATTLVTGAALIDVSGGWSNLDPASIRVNGLALDAHSIQPYYTVLLADEAGMRISASSNGEEVVFLAEPA